MSDWIEASLRDAVLALSRAGEVEIAGDLGRLLEEPDVRALRLYRSPAVASLADELLDCETLGELYGRLGRLCSTFSVAHCTIHCVRERNISAYATKVLTNYPEAWLSEYIARRYFSVDPVVSRALQEPGVFFWDEIRCEDPITGHFMRAAIEHGVGPSGITFVADNLHGDTIAVSLAVPLEHASFRKIFSSKLSDFVDLAGLLVDVFSDLACDLLPQSLALTDDQLRVLKALASGRSRDEVESFKVTYGSFGTLEKSILKTLNARTLIQAVAIAAKQRLLETLPYFDEDVYRGDDRDAFAA